MVKTTADGGASEETEFTRYIIKNNDLTEDKARRASI